MTNEHRPPSEDPSTSTTDDANATIQTDGSSGDPQRSPTRRSRRRDLLTVGASAALGAVAFGLASHTETGSPDYIVEGSNAPTPAVLGSNYDGGPGLEGDAIRLRCVEEFLCFRSCLRRTSTMR